MLTSAMAITTSKNPTSLRPGDEGGGTGTRSAACDIRRILFQPGTDRSSRGCATKCGGHNPGNSLSVRILQSVQRLELGLEVCHQRLVRQGLPGDSLDQLARRELPPE